MQDEVRYDHHNDGDDNSDDDEGDDSGVMIMMIDLGRIDRDCKVLR